MTRLTAKSSTILIATGEKTRVYHSLSDVPQGLRRKLESSTKGNNSATILIADRRGREELVRALQGKPASLHSRIADRLAATEERTPVKRTPRFSLRAWLELLVPVALGASLWLFIGTRF